VRCCVRASGVAVALAVLALAVVACTPVKPSPSTSPPTAVIDSPTPDVTWKVGDTITFAGSGIDAQGQPIPPSGMSWALIVHHCSTSCHEHGVQSFPGVADGSFVAPGHDYPSYLELRLTVTDAGGLSDVASVQLNPQTVDVTFQSNPSGVTMGFGSGTATTPFTRTVIVGSISSVSAPTTIQMSGTQYTFDSWSDGQPASHLVTAGASPTTYTADYKP